VTGVRSLLTLLDDFHITYRPLLRARERARAVDDADSRSALAREMARYFGSLAREAEADLSSLDARLDDLYQRQYNLQAERSVAERRLLGAKKVLAALAAAEEPAR
jgi:hypothetical protein